MRIIIYLDMPETGRPLTLVPIGRELSREYVMAISLSCEANQISIHGS